MRKGFKNLTKNAKHLKQKMPNKKSFAFFVRHFLSVFQIDFFLTVKYDFLFNAFLEKTFQKKYQFKSLLNLFKCIQS